MTFDDIDEIAAIAEEEAEEIRATADLDLSVADSLVVDGGGE